jgi:hypothetical protein
MVPLIGAILLICSFSVRIYAQMPAENLSKEQAPRKDADSAGKIAATPPGKTEYPLDSFKDFSAIMVGSIMEMGEGASEAHIYRSGELMRMEDPDGPGYLITDLTKLESYGISTGPCIHDNHPYFRASPFAAARPGSSVERVAAGKDTLDGHSCQIEDITVSSPKTGSHVKLRFWEAEDLQGFPIKIEFRRPGARSSIIRYKNVVLGPQDRTLFIYPKSCQSAPQRGGPKTPKAPAAGKKPVKH